MPDLVTEEVAPVAHCQLDRGGHVDVGPRTRGGRPCQRHVAVEVGPGSCPNIENVNELQRRVLWSANKRKAMSDRIVLPTLRVGVVCELEVDAALAPVHLQVGRVQHRRDPGGARREHPRRAPHGRPGQVEKCG